MFSKIERWVDEKLRREKLYETCIYQQVNFNVKPFKVVKTKLHHEKHKNHRDVNGCFQIF